MLGAADGRHGWLHFVEDKTHLCPFEPMVTPDSRETVEAFTPFSAASAVWKGTKPGDITAHRDETGRLATDLRLMEERLASALARLDHERERCSSHEEVRLMAEALLIHASGIRPSAASVSLPNPYKPEQTLSIKLDPSLSAHETADRLFTDARRMKRGLEELPGRRAPIEKDLSSLENARVALLEKGDPGPASNLLGKRFPEPSKESGTPFRAYKGPGRKHIFEEFTILVGRSASDNEKVTFQAAGPHDLWLHARDYAGSHVVILTKGIKVPEKVIYHAATLTAESSGAKNDSAPEIMITERKWVKKLKGGKPGMVTVERYRTVRPRTRKP